MQGRSTHKKEAATIACLLSLLCSPGCFREAPPKDACERLKAPQGLRCLSLKQYRDKMEAGWLGQMIGVSFGGPTEFLYRGEIIPEEKLPVWKPEKIANAFFEDDLYVEVTFLETLSQFGVEATLPEAAEMFANTTYPAWHANAAARERLRNGVPPELSGAHDHASDIDYQIESDFSGLISPGLLPKVVSFGDTFGRLICQGDCIYGGQFMGCLYAEAFFTEDPKALIQAGLRCIPKESRYAEAIRDVLQWHQESPTQWEKTWEKVEAKYNSPLGQRCQGSGQGKEGEKFNIEASLNGAYVAMGLLYGDKDIQKTLYLTTRFGQDSDCNPASALGVLLTSQGKSRLPKGLRATPPKERVFSHTDYTFEKLLSVSELLARKVVLSAGGQLQKTTNGEEVFWIPMLTK